MANFAKIHQDIGPGGVWFDILIKICRLHHIIIYVPVLQLQLILIFSKHQCT